MSGERLGCGWARVEDVSKRRRQGLVVCRATLPFEGLGARPGVTLAPTSLGAAGLVFCGLAACQSETVRPSDPDAGRGPLLLVAGGSGVVPLMAMVRDRAAHSSTVDTRLLLSARSSDDVLYRDELARLAAGDGLAVHQTFTREPPAGWSGFARRVDADMLSHVGPAPSQRPRIFICGPTAFVERAADLLVGLGHDTAAIHAERFGPTGG
jgi:Oxidoreductase NAD-binding domain